MIFFCVVWLFAVFIHRLLFSDHVNKAGVVSIKIHVTCTQQAHSWNRVCFVMNVHIYLFVSDRESMQTLNGVYDD